LHFAKIYSREIHSIILNSIPSVSSSSSLLSGISFISCFLILFASGLIGVIGLDMMIRDDVQDTPDTRTKHREIDLSKLARMFVLYFQEKNKSVKRMHVRRMYIVPSNTRGILQVAFRFPKIYLNIIKLGQYSAMFAFLRIRSVR